MNRWAPFLAITVLCCTLSSAATTKPVRVVLGYSASWRDDVSPSDVYDFGGLTHVVRAFLHPSIDGSIEVQPGYFNPKLESQAHRHGVKMLLGVGGGGGSDQGWLSTASHPEYVHRFVESLGQLMAANHYDGVDIDWEPSPSTLAAGQSYTALLKAIRSQFPHALLTTALNTDEYAVKFFPWPEVIASVDYVNAMSYDYAGAWGGVAGFATNLHPSSDYPALAQHSVEEGLQNLIQNHHVPPAKLLVGMNFWAYRFRAAGLGGSFPKNGAGQCDDLSYQQVLDLIGTGQYQAKFDARAAAPYLLRNGGGSVVVYDDPDSIRRKCEYAQKLGCAGVMIWNVGADQCGDTTPLMSAVVKWKGGTIRPLARQAVEAQLTQINQALQLGEQPPAGPLPASLSALSMVQLKSQYAQLNQRWGLMIDQLWQSNGEAK